MKPNSNYTLLPGLTSPLTGIFHHHIWVDEDFSYPGCTRRPSLHSESGPQWCSGPKSHQTPSSSAALPETWCHRLHPRPVAWCDLMSCGTRWGGTGQAHNLKPFVWACGQHFHRDNLNVQAELFLPDRVQVAVDGLCPFLGLSHLDGDIRVTGTSSVLGLETLSAHNWQNTQNTTTERLA